MKYILMEHNRNANRRLMSYDIYRISWWGFKKDLIAEHVYQYHQALEIIKHDILKIKHIDIDHYDVNGKKI